MYLAIQKQNKEMKKVLLKKAATSDGLLRLVSSILIIDSMEFEGIYCVDEGKRFLSERVYQPIWERDCSECSKQKLIREIREGYCYAYYRLSDIEKNAKGGAKG